MPPVIAAAGGFITAITGGAIAFGAPTAAFALGVAAASSSLFTTAALSAAAYALSRSLTDKGGSARRGINDPGIKGSVRQATPSQRVIYGFAKVGGAAFFIDDSVPPYLYLGLLISRRPITKILRTDIGENQATFDGSGNVLNEPYRSGSTVYLRRSVRLGSDTQAADPLLLAEFPSLGSDFRQLGNATIAYEFNYGGSRENFETLWGQVSIPNPLVTVQGAPVYDPRDGSQDVDDPSTWQFSNNASLVQADFLRQPYGGRIPTDQMRWDEIADSANYDDELVGLKDGGFQKRYTIDGVITLDQDPSEIMLAMLAANRGFVTSDRGRIYVSSSKPRDPVMTITDKMLRGGFQFRGANAKENLVNIVRTRFTSSEREYSLADGPVLKRADLITLDQEELDAGLSLSFTGTHQMAQRLANEFLEVSRKGRYLTCTLDRRALGLKAGHIVRIDSTLYPQMNGTYEVQSTGFADNYSRIPVTMTEYDKSIPGSWDPATDEADFELPLAA